MVLGLDLSAKMAAHTAVEPGRFPARTLHPPSVEHICMSPFLLQKIDPHSWNPSGNDIHMC